MAESRGGAMEDDGMTTEVDRSTEELRVRMVKGLVERGVIVSPAVEAAFRAVPRHRFAPEVSAADVYEAPEAIFTKRADGGRAVSSVSAPWLHARMLEAAELAPGMNVLEIGSGGCNAALLAEMVGPGGSVTTVDIDPDITDRAHRLLAETGYTRVAVRTADGAQPLDEAPAGGWDRIVVTTGAADLPDAWFSQLAPTGRLIVPLRFRSLSRTLAFTWEGEHLRSDTTVVSGFLAMQGASAQAPRVVRLADADVRLIVDEDQPVDGQALRLAFAGPRQERWTGVELTGSEGLLPRLDLWLAGAVTPYGRLRATKAAAERGLVGWVLGSGAGAVWNGDSLAYLTLRQAPYTPEHFELGVIGHGPTKDKLAADLGDAVRQWDATARHSGDPVVHAYPRRGAEQPVGVVIEKPSARLTVTP
ncbi:methyltransferase, FxLD system [Streptomyces durbertensis]|uniref:Protein-L-isoaspartate O-methyltransferase n=1 Tax=Streptomyces durbertensis TaxID=2448886 RepID=A0ABR6ELZ2_9ACTN|nr:methyltransferase, FxLD system [Streptomyces durbertensis]MBB1246349.1 methyltransferase, FxLD system [Streptomyces durbertensis]